MRIGIFLFLAFGLSCNSIDKKSEIIFPSGGYDFITPGNDTFFSVYPIKNIISRADSIIFAKQSYYYLKVFNEPNISLIPASKPTFRLFYESRAKLYIITLLPESITIKKWIEGHIFPDEDNKDSVKVIFETRKISIRQSEFVKLVNSINLSGYWQMPYERNCKNLSADNPGFALEVNTGYKYNFVRTPTCPDEIGLFDKACFEIIKKCNLQKEISFGIH